jgi:signal transduction histidine kinase
VCGGLLYLHRYRIDRQRTHYLNAMQARLLASQEAQDWLLQSILGVVWQIDASLMQLETRPVAAREQIESQLKRLDYILGEVRQAVWDLQFEEQACVEFMTQLQTLAKTQLANTHLQVEISSQGNERRLRPEVHHSLMFIVREAWFNVRQHSKATIVWTDVSFENDALMLLIHDNGVGMDLEHTTSLATTWGMSAMQQRALRIGGEFSMKSNPGQGTSIQIRIEGSHAYHPYRAGPNLSQNTGIWQNKRR